MTQKETLERALLMERRTVQRQRLLKQLWRLDHEVERDNERRRPSVPTSVKKGGRQQSKAASIDVSRVTIVA